MTVLVKPVNIPELVARGVELLNMCSAPAESAATHAEAGWEQRRTDATLAEIDEGLHLNELGILSREGLINLAAIVNERGSAFPGIDLGLHVAAS